MDPEEFRADAHRLVDWMTDYLAGIERFPVRAKVEPGAIAASLPAQPPVQGEAFGEILADVERIVVPGLTHWQHPRFLAYFPANSSPPAVLAEMLTATFAVQGMLWQTSPASTEIETVVLDWLRRMLGLPSGFTGVLQDTASTSTLVALVAARERATGYRSNERGLADSPPLAVYASEEAHSSIEKGVKIAGLGAQALRKIPTDEQFAMRVDALEAAIAADRASGIVPACVIACIGTTGVGAIDPVAEIGALCQRERIYLHVDAAWAGSALILPEHRHLAGGIAAADSVVINPHKWLMTNFDCSAHFVRDPTDLVRTFAINPTYLVGRETGSVADHRDWGIQLGRRFRALKLWFVVRSYGVEGLQAILRKHIELATELAATIRAEPDFELVTGPNLALLTFRYRPSGVAEAELDALNTRLLEAVNDDGRTYLTPTAVRGRKVIRISIGQTTTERRHVEEAWAAVTEIARGPPT